MSKTTDKALKKQISVARQPHLAMKADVTADKKTCERSEGAAAAVQAKNGDRCSVKPDQAGPTS